MYSHWKDMDIAFAVVLVVDALQDIYKILVAL
jgi:hypothetical protein